MPAMERYAFKAVAMVRALLLTGTVIPALPDLLQKLLFDLPCLLLLPTAIKIVLQNGSSFPSIFIIGSLFYSFTLLLG